MKPLPMIIMVVIVILSIVYAGIGLGMHAEVLVQEDQFHAANQAYWSIDKVTRESAVTGSDLTQQLVEIKNWPSELLRLKLVGVGRILTGIFLLLLGILMALVMMPVRLHHLMEMSKSKPKKTKK